MPEPPTESITWVHGAAKVKRLALPVGLLVGITAVSGAFVAGNDAVSNYMMYCLAISYFLLTEYYLMICVLSLIGHNYVEFPGACLQYFSKNG